VCGDSHSLSLAWQTLEYLVQFRKSSSFIQGNLSS
jgi:hypothetical protein